MSEKLSERLSVHKIDKKLPKWTVKKTNVSGKEIEIPSSLDGEILLEEDVDAQGRVRGWHTILPENLDLLFPNIVQNAITDGKTLIEKLHIDNDVKISIDLDQDIEDELSKLPQEIQDGLEDRIRKAYKQAKDFALTGVQELKVGILISERIIQKWEDEKIFE